MEIKAHDTFWQRRKLRGHGLQPILMEVLKMEEVIGTRDICKVRWHILNNPSIDYPKRKRRIVHNRMAFRFLRQFHIVYNATDHRLRYANIPGHLRPAGCCVAHLVNQFRPIFHTVC